MGKTMETVIDFIFLGTNITVDRDCSHEIKRCLVPWKESYDKPRQCIKKQRHHFINKVPYSKSHSFSSSHVWMWEVDHKEGWVSKNRYFRTVELEKTVEIPWTARRSNQSILKEINPEYSLEGLTCWGLSCNTLATWCKELTHWKRPWFWERLQARGEEGNN